MSFNSTPYKSRPPPGQLGSTPFRSSSASKFRSSLVPTSRPSPARPSNSPTKVTKTSTSARDLFRTTTPRGLRTTEFAPDLPAEATRPPSSVRKFAPHKSVSGGMSNTTSTEPFKMRIPSPDPDLTGRALAKEIPDDPNRTGSIYADQFLAHMCPPHFDELQRRQFFCILDLRRLKYAADEIFAKKDWKLNILNFAKEYEKSRGLIMLRYGLYEFKNVKPSSAVLKKWRAAHGLPAEPDSPQKSQTPGPSGSTKRKAEEELTSKDAASTASTVNQNKRRNLAHEVEDPVLAGPTPLKKNKRKAEVTDEIDESKPNKQLKSTSSTATSIFENILNKTRNDAASPTKQTSQSSSLFGVPPKPKDSEDAKSDIKANPFKSNASSLLFGSAKSSNTSAPPASVLSSHKVGSTPVASTGNIFKYLSESPSDSSGNEGDNVDGRESDSEPELDSGKTASGAVVDTTKSTPSIQKGPSLFAAEKTSTTPSIFGGLSKPADQTPKGGLFGRVQMGANGQPVRASPDLEDRQASLVNQPSFTSEQQAKQAKTPAESPGDYTFNPATTPISFGRPALDTSKPPTTESSVMPGPSESKKPVLTFGASTQASSTPKPSGLFGLSASTNPKSSGDSVSSFAQSKPTSTFGAPSSATAEKPLFGASQHTKEAFSTTKKQDISIFNKPATNASTLPETKPSLNKSDDKIASTTAPTKSQVPSIFDKSFIEKGAAQAKALSDSSKPSLDIFSRASNPLFSVPTENKADSSAPVTKNQTPSIFDKSFIEKGAAQAKALAAIAKPPSLDLFSRSSNPLFSAAKSNGTTSTDVVTKSISDQVEKPASSSSSSSNGALQTPGNGNKESQGPAFGGASAPVPPVKSIFGGPGGSNPPVSTASTVFGEKKTGEAAKPSVNIFSSAFGQKKAEEPTSFGSTVGEKKAGESAKPSVSIFSSAFGQKKAEEPTSFGSTVGEKKPGEPTKNSSTIFGSTPATNGSIFGSQATPNANTPAPPAIFGAAGTPGASLSFGASTSQANGSGPKNLGFQFGSSAPSAGSSSFTFGQDSPSGPGFTFTAGADKQPVHNPFTAPQPSSQQSAPVFGGGSFTSTPSSSFTFGLSQPPSSAPKVASSFQSAPVFGGSANPNGPPSFSFTQASPGPNPSDSKVSKSFGASPFGHLQAGEGFTAANNSFPPPSSIGTTPVSGTPEPQSPREEGDEAPQEQIKLTEGGPGEEDEIILHEVRAKAIKYVPVQKGDEDQPRSPWSTQGVGPLRVLKNKSTGAVRILLRAEPRGHIAMNKTILADIEYTAKEKTIHFAAASDDGSGLETWILQVKKPELARELASILEANKTANKK